MKSRLIHHRCSSTCNLSRVHVVTLLAWMGVPDRRLYLPRKMGGSNKHGEFGGFWKRPINHLALLEEARERYLSRIKAAHPDRGGEARKAADLVKVWHMISSRFKTHGYELL